MVENVLRRNKQSLDEVLERVSGREMRDRAKEWRMGPNVQLRELSNFFIFSYETLSFREYE